MLEIDKENRRLSLGHKQLEENPWNEFENQYSVDSIHEGTITEMTDKGAVVALGENIEGFCPARQLVKEDGTTCLLYTAPSRGPASRRSNPPCRRACRAGCKAADGCPEARACP